MCCIGGHAWVRISIRSTTNPPFQQIAQEKRCPRIQMVIDVCGDGPERGAIEGLIDQLGLRRSVSMVGEVQGIEAVAAQLAGCKALVLASTTDETWGLVVNEAMAASCPVLVSSQCGCARDLVEEGVNGFTFDDRDSDALARHMLWIHSNPDLLVAMGERSKEIVDRFAPVRFASGASKLARAADRAR
jgi:glycosyltransferase involved in cell wall biosynthesis